MSTALRYTPHYTVEDYQQWKGDWELWYGVAVSMSPAPFGPHELVVSRLVQLFRNQIEQHVCTCEVYAGLDWIVSNDTVVRPDVMIVCGEQPPRYLERPPILAVEVLSRSTASKDQHQKRELFQHQGVKYYLIADPATNNLVVLKLVDGGFLELSSAAIYTFELESGCVIELETQRLFHR